MWAEWLRCIAAESSTGELCLELGGLRLLQVHMLHALLHLGKWIRRLAVRLPKGGLLLLLEVGSLLWYLHVGLLIACWLGILLRLRLGHCLLVVVY